jgi:flagellar biosynthesis protein FlhB
MSAPPDKDQRTLDPTPKRIRDFRKRGEIALSKDLTGVAGLTIGAIALLATATATVGKCRALFIEILGHPDVPLTVAFGRAAGVLVGAALPVAVGAFLGILIVGGVQLGWPPALKGIGFDLTKVFSVQGIANIVNPKEMATRLLKSGARMVVALAAGAIALSAEIKRFIAAPALDPASLLERIGSATVRVGVITASVLLGFAAFDYFTTRRSLMQRMKMTPEEYKREHREQEGDPMVRRKRKQRMRELARRRLASSVQGADVVIVNPTHYAVALSYRQGRDKAPRVVAKGRGAVAERIREIARAAGIPILAQPPLCRLIHKVVPEGKEIPSNLYKAVAEILAYVYKLRRRGA